MTYFPSNSMRFIVNSSYTMIINLFVDHRMTSNDVLYIIIIHDLSLVQWLQISHSWYIISAPSTGTNRIAVMDACRARQSL